MLSQIEKLSSQEMDVIPKYLFMRDILKLDKRESHMRTLKNDLLKSALVQKVLKEQWEDGSWGRFHSLNTSAKAQYTTESALRRLLMLGLDKDDFPMKKALTYMRKYLKREIDLRDYKEKKHDWDLLTRLFVAVWILKIDPSDSLAQTIARDWAKVINSAFIGNEYDHEAYLETYKEVHNPEKNKHIWGFQNFYMITLLPGYINADVEIKLLDYLLNSDKGIYYIYDKKLMDLPERFCSKQSVRFIHAYDLLSEYSRFKDYSQTFVAWILENISENELWDFSSVAKDRIHLPLSSSWRNPQNRIIDSTLLILKILLKIKNQ